MSFYRIAVFPLLALCIGTLCHAQNTYWSQTAPYPFDAGAQVPTPALIVTPDGYYLAGAGDGAGIYRSVDTGRTWTQSAGSSWYSHCNAYCIARSGRIIAAMHRNVDAKDSSWLLSSVNKGANFTKLAFPNIRVSRLYTAPDSTIYAASDNGVYRSQDDGKTWERISAGLPANGKVNMVVQHKDKLYAAVENEGLFRSTDGGKSWKDAEAGVYFNYTRDLAIFPDGSLAAGTQYGLFRSQDGNEWETLLGNGSRIIPIQTIFGAPNGDLYTGMNGDGAYISRDNGRTWAQLLTGFKSFTVNAIALDSAGRLVCATNTGVFRSLPGSKGLLSVQTMRLDFGTIKTGRDTVINVLLSNAGDAPVTVSSAYTSSLDSTEFMPARPFTAFTLNPGDTTSFAIKFKPVSAGDKETDLRFMASGNFSSSNHIILTGKAEESVSSVQDKPLHNMQIEQNGDILMLRNLQGVASLYTVQGIQIAPAQSNAEFAMWKNVASGAYFIMYAGTIYPVMITR
jgi:photosystem II stability/assembly factor-like uncharacterized protein